MSIIKNKPGLILVLTGISFLVGGLDCYENGPVSLAYVSFIVAGLNISMFFFFKKYPYGVKLILLFINAFFAAFSSYAYFIADKDKIQYGWALVCVINLVVIIRAIKKKKTKKEISN